MKNLIFSDSHGRSIKPLLTLAKEEGIERVIGLGDYDTPQVLRELIATDLDKIIVIGNHDYSYVKGLPVESELMKGSFKNYMLQWFNTPEQQFILEAVKKPNKTRGLIVTRTIGKKKIAFSHSSLTKAEDWERGFPLCMLEKVTSKASAKHEFRLMGNRGVQILFRGHDHYSGVYTLNSETKEVTERFFQPKISLETNSRHIVCVGAYYHGEYCLFDDKTNELEFISPQGVRLKGP